MLDTSTAKKPWPGARKRPATIGLASVALATATLTTATGAGEAAIAASASSAAAATSSGPPLVVYSAQGYDSAEVAAFEKATPGVKVTLDDDSTGPLLVKVEAEKNNPKWGVLWVDGATAFASLDQQGLLLKGWEPTVSWNSLGKANVPADKSYVPTGLTMAGTLVYDSRDTEGPADDVERPAQPQVERPDRHERPRRLRAHLPVRGRDDELPRRHCRR